MAHPPPDPEAVAEVVRLVRAGNSLREVAHAAGVSYGTVRRWVAKAAPPKEAAVPSDVKARARKLVSRAQEPDEPPEVDPLEGVDEKDELAFTRAMRARALAQAKTAEREGNLTAAQRALTAAGDMSP